MHSVSDNVAINFDKSLKTAYRLMSTETEINLTQVTANQFYIRRTLCQAECSVLDVF